MAELSIHVYKIDILRFNDFWLPEQYSWIFAWLHIARPEKNRDAMFFFQYVIFLWQFHVIKLSLLILRHFLCVRCPNPLKTHIFCVFLSLSARN